MHVLMLGWEFPPFITGGLGTACYGLTRALDERGVDVTFVLPKHVDSDHAAHIRLVSPAGVQEAADAPIRVAMQVTEPSGADVNSTDPRLVNLGHAQQVLGLTDAEETRTSTKSFQRTTFLPVEAGFFHPYTSIPTAQPVGQTTVHTQSTTTTHRVKSKRAVDSTASEQAHEDDRESNSAPIDPARVVPIPGMDSGADMVTQSHRYADFCLAAARHLDFDVIHAHDWMTYPAGLYIARATGKPLVVHVHSTEFDRSGDHVHQAIYDIERRGMHGALRIITVSQLTRNIAVRRYGVSPDHIDVVYNGVDTDQFGATMPRIESKDKIVLYFGRITHQKGPEYFVRAAKRVLEYLDDVKFVVAGSGDMARRMIELAADLGIGHKILFTGFLRGRDIARVFSLADLYVMPSISEPFGIAPLEAMSHDVPALISKSSGVSEVLTHALKVDFWDIDDMANKIIAVLRHPPLSETLRQHGAFEVRRLTWAGAAERCERVYQRAIEMSR